MANSTNDYNNTFSENDDSFGYRAVYDTCLIILALFIIAVNVLVISLFIRKDYLRTKTNCFLISLACSDITVGLVSIPLYLIYYVVPSPICAIISAMLYRCIAASTMFHILVVTLERYVAVMYPMHYHRMVTKQRVCIVIAIVWFFSIMYAVISITWLDFGQHDLKKPNANKYDLPYNIASGIICFLLPLVIMTICFMRMILVIRRQVKKIRKQTERTADPRNRSIASDKRAIVIFASMLIIFIVCWLSWYITVYDTYIDEEPIIAESSMDVLEFLRFATSLFNPLLYTFLKHDFRRAVKSLCCFKRLSIMLSIRQESGRHTTFTEVGHTRHHSNTSADSEANHGQPEQKEKEMVELISKV